MPPFGAPSQRTFHQPAAGVVDGPSSTASCVPHGIAVMMAAAVPTPLRRLSDVAVTRAVPPGASAAGPSPPFPSESPSSGACPMQAVKAMHVAKSAGLAPRRPIERHDSIDLGVGDMKYLLSLALFAGVIGCTKANPDANGGAGGSVDLAAGTGGGGGGGNGG